MPDGNGANAPLFRLIYLSHSRIPSDRRQSVLADILNTARSNNTKLGITGALLITDHYFVQALEGAEAAVRSLYDRIREDARHENPTLVETGIVDSRVFSRWAMAQVSSAGHADIPLDTTESGLTFGPSESITREQYALLKRMRATIGADTV